MSLPSLLLTLLLALPILPLSSPSPFQLGSKPNLTTTPFNSAIDALQTQIGYRFKAVDLLRRAMTHASYSAENYRTLSALGLDAARAAVALRCLKADPDASPAELSRRVVAATAERACAADGLKLGLDKIVRVSAKTNASAPVVVCGAFRAVFGAVALDSGKLDVAGDAFRRVHGGASALDA